MIIKPFVKYHIDQILIKEGNGIYTNDPKDSGGPTRWGMTEKVARAEGYKGDMRELPREFAFDVLLRKYWTKPGFYHLENLFPELSECCLDFGVVAGQANAGQFVQRMVNVLNRNERDYKDLKVDGIVGKITHDSVNAFLKKRGDEGRAVLLGGTVSLMSNYFITLAERRPKDEEYVYGWLLNRAIGKYVCLEK